MSKPASPYLHDRLQARRAHPTTRRSDTGPRLSHLDDDIFLDEARSYRDSSYATPPANHSNAPVNPAATLGAREMEKRMDKLSKLNFDLKLELFHCRERMAKLQENCKALASQAGKANRLVDENKTLLELNDTLVKELEHRDEAVQEAVTIICDLEERLEKAQGSASRRHSPTRPPREQSTPPRRNALEPSPEAFPSPPKFNHPPSSRSDTTSPKRRVPSFVGDKKPSTRALRSVYLEPTQTLRAVKSYASLVSQREDGDRSVSEIDIMDSPRLSVLSESSFPSIYDLRRDDDTTDEANQFTLDSEEQVRVDSRQAGSIQDSKSDCSSWVQVQTPQLPSRHFESGFHQQPRSDPSSLQLKPFPASFPDQKQSSLGAPQFGALLPPTPESASTSLLQDSYLSYPGDVKAAPRVLANFANAAKHTALLHTPETPAMTDGNQINRKSRPRASMPAALWSKRHSISLSSTDEEEEYDYGNSEVGSRPGSADTNEAYPDGGSISTGTPSRFQLKHGTSPATNLLFDGEGIDRFVRPQGKRRNTSFGEAQLSPSSVARQRMERSETTPNLGTLRTSPAFHTGRPTGASNSFDLQRALPQQLNITTPASPEQHQQRFIDRPDSLPQILPKDTAHSSKNEGGGQSGGMRATLSQKTHKLLRRMSDARDPRPRLSTANPSVLTKSSTFAALPARNTAFSPKRPNTSNGGEESMALQAANQAISSRAEGFGATLSPQREHSGRGGLFRRAAGSMRR